MKLTHYLYIASAALLVACYNEETATVSVPNSDNGPIQVSAGIVEGGQQVMTRADAEDATRHGKHLALTNGTKLALQVNGEWHHASATTENISKTTTATVGTETSTDSKHNEVIFTSAETLYWDDYGTADPDNAGSGKGREKGLTIFGVAIDGKTSALTVTDWTALSWTLTADQTTTGNTPADKDLLISNNVKGTTSNTPYDGNYRFDKKDDGKLLEFKHALSKITVLLKPGDGFGGAFASTPTVTLTSNDGSSSNEEWPYTTSTVNVTTGEVSSQSTHSAITMNTTTSTTLPTGYTVAKEALVMPGSEFKGKDGSNYPYIAKINADGNIYYVTDEKIRQAIDGANYASTTAFPTEAGKNYILKVIVNKTDIVVTATVTNWTNVIAAEVEPVINIGEIYGASNTALGDGFNFSFYRSTALDNGYSNTLIENSFYKEESVVSKTGGTWYMSEVLYWPNHNTHYQFRGVWPQTVTTSGTGILSSPRVEEATHTVAGNNITYQVIKVQNVAYDDDTFPSDLQIARPEIDASEQCTNNETGHTKTYLYYGGICATEGTINLNFRYMMSQVEVNLTTTTGSDAVNLTGAVVELVNVYNTGDVKLGDRGVIATGTKGAYTLNTTFQGHDGNNVIDINSHPNRRWSAIVPQPLTYTAAQADGNVKFKITIYNDNNTTDIYYADVQPIPVTVQGSSDPAAPITEWESGKHYIYNLMLSKTDVKVTATLADWTKVTTSEDV